MQGYVLRYAFWAPLLFALLYFEGFSPLFFIANLQTVLTAKLTEVGIVLCALPITLDGIVIAFKSGFTLQILHECNGFAPILLFWAAVWSYPTDIKLKVFWTLLGYTVLIMVNIMRIMLILYVVDIDKDNLTWSHNYVGRYGMGVMTLMLFWIFTQIAEVKPYRFLTTISSQKGKE